MNYKLLHVILFDKLNNEITQVPDLENFVPVFNAKLSNDKHTMEGNVVLFAIVAPNKLHDVPELEPPIDCFMSSSRSTHCFPVFLAGGIIRSHNASVPAVATISNNLLANSKHLFDFVAKNPEIRPASCFKRSSKRDNPAGLDAHRNLVAETRAFELVGVPALVKRRRFQNFKVSSIDGDQTALIVVVVKAVLPLDLQRDERVQVKGKRSARRNSKINNTKLQERQHDHFENLRRKKTNLQFLQHRTKPTSGTSFHRIQHKQHTALPYRST